MFYIKFPDNILDYFLLKYCKYINTYINIKCTYNYINIKCTLILNASCFRLLLHNLNKLTTFK